MKKAKVAAAKSWKQAMLARCLCPEAATQERTVYVPLRKCKEGRVTDL